MIASGVPRSARPVVLAAPEERNLSVTKCFALLLLRKSLQEAPRDLGVATRLDNLVEHISVPVNRSRQSEFLTVDADHDFIQVPHIVFR